MQIYGTFVYLHDSAEQKSAKLRNLRTTYQWMSANLPDSATVLSYDDGLLYLYTGHRGNYIPLLPRFWYSGDYQAMIRPYRGLTAYCRERGLEYIYFSDDDLDRELGEELKHQVQKAVHDTPGLTPLYATSAGTVYKVQTNQANP
jgi:hypothetical protein